jgi:hypothetical protein
VEGLRTVLPRQLLRFIAFTLAATSLGASAFCITCPPMSWQVEYENSITGRHVWIQDVEEMLAIDSGAAGPGWRKNGHTFATVDATNPALVDVCRFYAPSLNSHFITANATECAALKANGGPWIFEKVAFKVYPATHAACPDPVYRLRNDNHVAQNTSVHRFTWDPYVRSRLLVAGWVEEGIAFCVTDGYRSFEKSETVRAQGNSPLLPMGDCDSQVGSCVLARNLPAMGNSIRSYDSQGARNPAFDAAYDDIIGLGAHPVSLHTAQPVADRSAVAGHSFALTGTLSGMAHFGFHLVGRDRLSGDYATMAAVYRLAASDTSFAPWADGHDRDLSLSFGMQVRKVRTLEPSSHAYGLGLLQFRDRASGRVFNLTLGAFGTMAPGTFAARDVVSGQVLTSVPLGDAPALGFTREGRYLRCSGGASGAGCAEVPAGDRFEYTISRGDFAKAVATARQLEPALSADPRDYAVSSFQVRAETYRDAEIGVALWNVTLYLSQ